MSVADTWTGPHAATPATWAEVLDLLGGPDTPTGCPHRADRLCRPCLSEARKGWERVRHSRVVEMLFIHQAIPDRVSCFHCGDYLDSMSFTIDHLTALARGGSNDIGNLAFSCDSCNSRKGSK